VPIGVDRLEAEEPKAGWAGPRDRQLRQNHAMMTPMPVSSTNPRAKRINLLMLAVVIVLLGVEVARGVGGLRAELQRAPSAPGGNQVAAELLAPRLLDDRDDLTSFLDDFAPERYRVFVSHVVPLRFAAGRESAVITLPGPTPGEAAEVRSLDSFGFHDLSLIRIDADSAEDGVLEGARKTLARERPTLLVAIRGDADFNTALPELRAQIVHTIQLIEQMGYLVTRLGVADYLGTPRGTP
jgi:hypothetical protein